MENGLTRENWLEGHGPKAGKARMIAKCHVRSHTWNRTLESMLIMFK